MNKVDRQSRGLTAPLGEAGSGLVRYAAAMTLYQSELIGPDTLEVFRACAPDDKLDPVAELIRLGIAADIPLLARLFKKEVQS